jgi:predicted nucleic acid-binding protein
LAAFVDTNVAVSVFDHGAGEKRDRAIELLTTFPEQLVVSTQVLSEFYWTVTRKLDPALPPGVAAEAVRQLGAFRVVAIDRELVLDGIRCSQEVQLALWDAMIVEAAVRGGCDRVFTEDLGHGQEIRGVRIENPFRD